MTTADLLPVKISQKLGHFYFEWASIEMNELAIDID